MVGVDIENDRRRREKVQERIAVFAALQNDRVAAAYAVPRAEQREAPADHDRRVALRPHEDVRQHRRCGRLAVCPRDADRIFVRPHQMAPRLRPLEDRDARGARGSDLRIVIVGGGRADDAVGALDILLTVADVDGDPAALELLCRDGGVHVRAGDLHAHAPQHKAERPHRHAADPDQMRPPAGQEILFYGTAVCRHHQNSSR